MRIAVAAQGEAKNALIPDTYEESPVLLIFETDTGKIISTVKGPDVDAYYQAIMHFDCEAVVCGPHIGQVAFDPIADASITRYQGDGLPALDAAMAADANFLPLIREYEGGPGCQPRTCEEAGHDHGDCDGDCGSSDGNCDSCDLVH